MSAAGRERSAKHVIDGPEPGRGPARRRPLYRSPVKLTLTLLPGPEPWVRVECGDRTWLTPASKAVWEVVARALGK